MITPIKSQINQHQNQQLKRQQSFKGAEVALAGLSTAFNFLNTNPALGAVFVDVAFMDIPRTVVDANRSVDAGIETGIRDFGSTANHAIAGFTGAGAGYLAALGLNKANGIKSHLMFMNSDSIDVFSKFLNENGSNEKYFYNVFKNAEGLVKDKWKGISDATAKEAADILNKADKSKYEPPKEARNRAKFLISSEIGATETYQLKKDEKTVTSSVDKLIDDAWAMLKTAKDKAEKTGKIDSQFLSKLKQVKTSTAIAGLAVPVAIGMTWQPLNAYMTKKRTGKGGFVGVEGREPDKSTRFKVLKTGLGTVIAAGMLSTIGKPKEILTKIQYKGLVPTIPQFKLIYATTIFSRMLAARDKNELRECTLKDTLGFLNWLILGGFVSKLTANGLNKDLINYDKKVHGKGKWNWITKSEVKAHEEILYPALKKAGIETVQDGKPAKFGKLMKQLAEKAKAAGASKDLLESYQKASKHIRYKNIAQAVGYAYSGLVLGIGIPKLNIAVTNKFEKNKKVKQAEENLSEKSVPTGKSAEGQTAQKVAAFLTPIDNNSKTFSSFFGAMQSI